MSYLIYQQYFVGYDNTGSSSEWLAWRDKRNNFNADISGWDVSNVTNMTHMFSMDLAWAGNEAAGAGVQSIFNQDISGWDVSNVTVMQGMFDNAQTFNQPIGGWDVSNVTNMNLMFYRADGFNQDLSGWDVSNGPSMSFMFLRATAIRTQYSSLPETPVPADWSTYWS